MVRSIKAVLLSAFVFPGVGHFFLKKHLAGSVLACTALAPLSLVIYKTVEWVLQTTEQIQLGEVPLDVAAITELVSGQPTGAEAQLLNIASAVFFISWLTGMVDSYRIGLLQDKEDAAGE